MDEEVDWSPEKENEYGGSFQILEDVDSQLTPAAALPAPEEDDKMEGSSSSVTATAGRAPSPVLPSVAEVRLSMRLEQLERERDAAVAELQLLKSRQDAPPPTQIEGRIVIPQELLPTLNILQTHIAELTRDNEALRYTFIGPTSTPAPASASAAAGQKTPNGLLSTTSASTAGVAESGPIASPALPSKVDLAGVVERVKGLLKENEELGEMVFELGRTSPEAWQQALDESKAVISSLDSDLTHHLGVVESLRGYRTRYGALDGKEPPARGPASTAIASTSSQTSRAENTSGRRESDTRHRSHRPDDSRRHDGRSDTRDRERDRDRDRDRDKDKDRNRDRDRNSERDRDKYHRDRNRDGQPRDRPKDKEKESEKGQGSGPKAGGPNGLSIMGHAHSHSRDDARDRDPKRRK